VSVPSRKLLRDYQARLITDVCRAEGHVLVEQPTGSGKTLQIVALVAKQLGKRYTHAVIAAPQQQIEHGFVERDYRLVAFPTSAGVAVPDFEAERELILGSRQSGLGSVRRLLAYLRQTGSPDHALACTHAALNKLTAEELPDDLTGKALFLDEAHHASADGLSEVVTTWQQRGGQLFFFTATPYRGDGRPVRLEGMRVFRRSLAEHMAEGYAPRHLESEIVALGQPGDAITAGQFTGEEAPPRSYFDGLIAAICCRWSEDGQPKTIVRVPPMKGGRGGDLVSRLGQAFSSLGARVLDATGTSAADKQRFLTGLEAEKSRTYATSIFDVMIGIQRVLEGTDWPVCSAVYCVGMPGSLNTVVQFLGRAMRRKGEDYPAAQRDRARLVFFVPCGGGAALADLSLDHSRHALLTCCFLADHEVGQEWIVLREVRHGIESALGKPAENSAAADAENEADEPLAPEVRAEVELVMATAREQIVSDGGEPTVGEVVRLAAQTRPDLPETALQRVAAEILAAQTTPSGAAVREVIRQEVARRLRIDPRVKEAMEEAFAVVLEEFRDVTLQDSAVLESVGRQVHGVTGGQMQEFARRLRDAAPRPLTEEQILSWADSYNERMGNWPQVTSGAIEDSSGDTWLAIHQALVNGSRGLSGGSSLARLLAACRGKRNPKDLPPLTEAQILAWAEAHYDRTGRWPNVASGSVEGVPGEVWANIDAALTNGTRGLPGNSTLAKMLARERGVRNRMDLPDLSTEMIIVWADKDFERTGRWPTANSGAVLDAPGETWKGVDMALIKGNRGLPGGSSLARLLAEQRDVRHLGALPPLTIDQILQWADAEVTRVGKWPSGKMGAIAEAPNETWRGVDSALRRGTRGLPGGSTLAQLLDEHRGVRNRKRLVDLTVLQILEWVDEHHECTGEWPTLMTGPIIGHPGETWAGINHVLLRGSRGLPTSCSLADLLAEHRGIRNIKNPPKLAEHQLLTWVDKHQERTGQWPKVLSGPILEAPGDTWRHIDNALRIGLRGLSGGSSLARLIREHRGATT